MKKIIRILAFCFLPFLLTAQGLPADGLYCNARFDYCVEYPQAVLGQYKLADNSDGVILYTEGEELEVEIAGSNNVMDWGFQDLYEMNLEALSLLYGRVEVERFNQTDRYFEFEVALQEGAIYQRTYNFNGVLVTLEIRAGPGVSPALFKKLQDEIRVTVDA